MEVVRHDLRPTAKRRSKCSIPSRERAQRLVVLQVADVVADPGPAVPGQAEGALQLRTAGEDRTADIERQVARDVAAAAAQELRPPRDHAHDRVVGPRLDGPVSHQEEVGDPREPLQGVGVPVGDRLVGDVGAGEDERGARIAEQQVMERRVRQHDAELAGARRDRRRDRRIRPARGQHDRALARGEQPPGGIVQLDQLERHLGGWAPSGRRAAPPGASGRAAQPTTASSSARQARWNPPIPLTATIRPSARARAVASSDGVVPLGDRPPRAIGEPERRPAVGTGVGLGVEAAVEGILVFGPAPRAHLERRHRRQGPVVGHSAHDREARPAVRAVRERIAVPPVPRIHHLGETVIARRHIGRDGRIGAPAVLALRDPEARLAGRIERLIAHPLDDRQRGSIRAQPLEQPLEGTRLPLGLDQHPPGVVQHPARQVKLGCQPVDEGTKADALHGPLNPHPHPLPRSDAHRSSISSRSAW